jgi:hypothetical protein
VAHTSRRLLNNLSSNHLFNNPCNSQLHRGSREKVAEVVEGGPEVVLGRYELYSYALRDPDTISRVHVRFVSKGGKLYVRDDGSTNGTYIDGQDIRGKGEVELPPGKEVLLVNPKAPVVKLVAESA